MTSSPELRKEFTIILASLVFQVACVLLCEAIYGGVTTIINATHNITSNEVVQSGLLSVIIGVLASIIILIVISVIIVTRKGSVNQ